MRKRNISYITGALLLGAIAQGGVVASQAHTLYKSGNTDLNFNISAAVGIFHSKYSYSKRSYNSHPTWEEGYAKYGFKGTYSLNKYGSLYGSLALISTFTTGDGDAAGYTIGNEKTTAVEDAYIGWESGNLVPELGFNGIKISYGTRKISIGNGFLIDGDVIDFGHGFSRLAEQGKAPRGLGRGGDYYLAGRQDFNKTAVLRLGGKNGFHGAHAVAFWLKSNNPAQAKTGLAGIHLYYKNSKYGKVYGTYIRGLSVNNRYANYLGLNDRKGQNTVAFGAKGDLGINKNLFLSTEYVHQSDHGSVNAHAWFAEVGWKFANAPWSPSIHYRYSSFSKHYDYMFFGDKRGFGTWYQGEVAANYAGPFNENTNVNWVKIKAHPTNKLTLAGYATIFRDTRNNGRLNAEEYDFYADYQFNKYLSVIPLFGIYNPHHSASNGGSQIGSSSPEYYEQIMATFSF